MYSVKHIVLTLCAAVIVGCTAQRKQGSEAAENASKAYEDTIYCFNGRSIVFSGGLAGCITDDGREVIPPVWDSLEFLSSDVLMLYRAGLAVLATKDGRIFSESAPPAALEAEFEERYSKLEISDILFWDGILDRLDSLCNECLAQPRSGIVSDPSALSLADEIKHLLLMPQGRMTPAQIARLEGIEDRFLSLRR